MYAPAYRESQLPAPGVSDSCSIHDTCKHSVVRTPLHILQMTWTSEAGRYLHWTKPAGISAIHQDTSPGMPPAACRISTEKEVVGFAFLKVNSFEYWNAKGTHRLQQWHLKNTLHCKMLVFIFYCRISEWESVRQQGDKHDKTLTERASQR